MCSEGIPAKYLPTIFTLIPYKSVARITKETNKILLLLPATGCDKKSKTLPVKEIQIPITLMVDVLLLKKRAPMIITNTGVRAFSEPASELSIFVSAKQNKYAGNRLPCKPDRKMTKTLLFGIDLICLIATGNKTIPENIIRKDATW